MSGSHTASSGADQRRLLADAPEHRGHGVGGAMKVGAEERRSDDGQGQAAHLGADIDARTRGPFIRHARGFGDHRTGVERDLRAVERRLQHPPALAMPRFLAGEQAVADEFRAAA